MTAPPVTDIERLSDRHGPDARHGRRPAGELRPSRDADGDGAARVPPVPRDHGARSERPAVAGPRPVRAQRRPRVDAAVRRAAPLRLRPAARGAEAVPPVGLAHARPPRARPRAPDARRRGHDRPARPGLRQRGRHGDGRALPARALRPRAPDHRVFAIVSDGDLMEGIAAEAASLAGHLGLGRIVYLYDDNAISPRRPDLARFEARTSPSASRPTAGTSRRSRTPTTRRARAADPRGAGRGGAPVAHPRAPIIGWPAPNKQGTSKAHGAPLGEDEVRATKEDLGWDPDATSSCPTASTRRSAPWSAARRLQRRVGRAGSRLAREDPSSPRSGTPRGRGRAPGVADALPDRLGQGQARDARPGRRSWPRSRPPCRPWSAAPPDLSESTKTEFPERAGVHPRARRAQRLLRRARARHGRAP